MLLLRLVPLRLVLQLRLGLPRLLLLPGLELLPRLGELLLGLVLVMNWVLLLGLGLKLPMLLRGLLFKGLVSLLFIPLKPNQVILHEAHCVQELLRQNWQSIRNVT